jgi:hypothetical protein
MAAGASTPRRGEPRRVLVDRKNQLGFFDIFFADFFALAGV